MYFQNFFDRNARFRSIYEIKEVIKNSKNYQGEDPDNANILQIFSTSKQRTYLVATRQRLYCILDDVRKTSPHINWSMSKSEIKNADGIKLEITSYDKTDKIGFVDFGKKHKRWFFTKNLFLSKNIEDSIKDFLDDAM